MNTNTTDTTANVNLTYKEYLECQRTGIWPNRNEAALINSPKRDK